MSKRSPKVKALLDRLHAICKKEGVAGYVLIVLDQDPHDANSVHPAIASSEDPAELRELLGFIVDEFDAQHVEAELVHTGSLALATRTPEVPS